MKEARNFITDLRNLNWHRCLPVNVAKFLGTPFFIEHVPVAASLMQKLKWNNIHPDNSGHGQSLFFREAATSKLFVEHL